MFDFAKEKIFTVWGGTCEMMSVLRPLQYLMVHMEPTIFFKSLDYLIEQNTVDQKFVDFFQDTCGGSNLELKDFLTSKVGAIKK